MADYSGLSGFAEGFLRSDQSARYGELLVMDQLRKFAEQRALKERLAAEERAADRRAAELHDAQVTRMLDAFAEAGIPIEESVLKAPGGLEIARGKFAQEQGRILKEQTDAARESALLKRRQDDYTARTMAGLLGIELPGKTSIPGGSSQSEFFTPDDVKSIGAAREAGERIRSDIRSRLIEDEERKWGAPARLGRVTDSLVGQGVDPQRAMGLAKLMDTVFAPDEILSAVQEVKKRAESYVQSFIPKILQENSDSFEEIQRAFSDANRPVIDEAEFVKNALQGPEATGQHLSNLLPNLYGQSQQGTPRGVQTPNQLQGVRKKLEALADKIRKTRPEVAKSYAEAITGVTTNPQGYYMGLVKNIFGDDWELVKQVAEQHYGGNLNAIDTQAGFPASDPNAWEYTTPSGEGTAAGSEWSIQGIFNRISEDSLEDNSKKSGEGDNAPDLTPKLMGLVEEQKRMRGDESFDYDPNAYEEAPIPGSNPYVEGTFSHPSRTSSPTGRLLSPEAYPEPPVSSPTLSLGEDIPPEVVDMLGEVEAMLGAGREIDASDFSPEMLEVMLPYLEEMGLLLAEGEPSVADVSTQGITGDFEKQGVTVSPQYPYVPGVGELGDDLIMISKRLDELIRDAIGPLLRYPSQMLGGDIQE